MPTTITPAKPTEYTSPYGGKPAIPNPIGSAGDVIAGNLGNLGQLYQLANGVNDFQNRSTLAALANNLPGYTANVAQSSGNIGQHLRGQVGSDVISNLIQWGNERGIGTGQGVVSPNTNAAYMRALGLTSNAMQAQGEQELTQAIARTPQAKPFDITSLFVSPEQQQGAQTNANVIAAAPNPQAQQQAQQDAVNQGIRAGAGAVPQPVIPGYAGGSRTGLQSPNLGTMVAPSLGGATYYNGVPVYEGSTPSNAQGNWNDWYNQTFGSQNTGSDQGSNFWDDNMEDVLNYMETSPQGTYAGADYSYSPDYGYSDLGGLADSWLGSDLSAGDYGYEDYGDYGY